MNFSVLNHFDHVYTISRIDILKLYTILSFLTLLHCALGPSFNFVGLGGPLCLCVCMSDVVTQQGMTALSDSPPHGPVCLPTSQPNLTFTSILVLRTRTDVAPI